MSTMSLAYLQSHPLHVGESKQLGTRDVIADQVLQRAQHATDCRQGTHPGRHGCRQMKIGNSTLPKLGQM